MKANLLWQEIMSCVRSRPKVAGVHALFDPPLIMIFSKGFDTAGDLVVEGTLSGRMAMACRVRTQSWLKI